ncbi:MAG: hypothetical protein MZV70_63835 [Desulfobacterales bacterium]|nr:hypothetical protein [Desulfobacterales bacterium]
MDASGDSVWSSSPATVLVTLFMVHQVVYLVDHGVPADGGGDGGRHRRPDQRRREGGLGIPDGPDAAGTRVHASPRASFILSHRGFDPGGCLSACRFCRISTPSSSGSGMPSPRRSPRPSSSDALRRAGVLDHLRQQSTCRWGSARRPAPGPAARSSIVTGSYSRGHSGAPPRLTCVSVRRCSGPSPHGGRTRPRSEISDDGTAAPNPPMAPDRPRDSVRSGLGR